MTIIRKRLPENQPKIDLISMTAKELKQLKAKIDFLLNNMPEDNDDTSYHLFYDLLTTKLSKILKSDYPPYPIFKKTKIQYKRLIAVVDYLDDLLISVLKSPKKKHYRKMYRMYITLVIKEIQNSPLPLEVPIILNYKDKFLSILDNNFPGYLENGLLKMLF